jgi:hypothetical protein
MCCLFVVVVGCQRSLVVLLVGAFGVVCGVVASVFVQFSVN